mgnify:CR=1 FL=1
MTVHEAQITSAARAEIRGSLTEAGLGTVLEALGVGRSGASALIAAHGTTYDGVALLAAGKLLDLCHAQEDVDAFHKKEMTSRPPKKRLRDLRK